MYIKVTSSQAGCSRSMAFPAGLFYLVDKYASKLLRGCASSSADLAAACLRKHLEFVFFSAAEPHARVVDEIFASVVGSSEFSTCDATCGSRSEKSE